MPEENRQKLSALVDGELPAAEAGRVLDTLGSDPLLREAWSRYQLIGTALRRGVPERFDSNLGARVSAAIADQQPEGDEAPLLLTGAPATVGRWRRPVVGLALAASVAALAIIGLRTLQAPGEAPLPIAKLGGMPLTAEILPVAGRLDQKRLARYMIRHNELASARAMQGVLPYVRVVSQDTPVPHPQR